MMLGISVSDLGQRLNLYSSKRQPIASYAIDSRKVVPNGCFFALKGAQWDGHDFLEEVAKAGGIAAIVSESYQGPDFGLTLFRVKSVVETLQTLATSTFQMRKEQVIAITGSMGKTTTKEFLATLLSAKFRVFKTPGNQNTQLSLPLLLLNLDDEYEVLVLEMAMTAHGHIRKLCEIAPPDFSILTRIAPAGMANFEGGLEAIAKAKSEIFSHPRTKRGLISAQAAQFARVLYAGSIPKMIYGKEGDFSYVLEKGGVRMGQSPLLQPKFSATHLLENFLGAVSAARMMGLSWHEITQKVSELKPFEKRFETIEKGGVTYIQDCYNANPDSMVAALENLPKGTGRVLGVLGAMPDLGKASAHYHELVGREASKHLDELFCIGHKAKGLADAFAKSGKPALYSQELAEIEQTLAKVVKPGDVVLIKGGNSLKLWTLLESPCYCY